MIMHANLSPTETLGNFKTALLCGSVSSLSNSKSRKDHRAVASTTKGVCPEGLFQDAQYSENGCTVDSPASTVSQLYKGRTASQPVTLLECVCVRE